MIHWLWEDKANQLTPTEIIHLLAQKGKMNQITHTHLDGTKNKNVSGRQRLASLLILSEVSQSAEAEWNWRVCHLSLSLSCAHTRVLTVLQSEKHFNAKRKARGWKLPCVCNRDPFTEGNQCNQQLWADLCWIYFPDILLVWHLNFNTAAAFELDTERSRLIMLFVSALSPWLCPGSSLKPKFEYTVV